MREAKIEKPHPCLPGLGDQNTQLKVQTHQRETKFDGGSEKEEAKLRELYAKSTVGGPIRMRMGHLDLIGHIRGGT